VFVVLHIAPIGSSVLPAIISRHGVLKALHPADDGTVGLAAVKRAGGLTIVQDPDEAEFRGMPAHALDHVHPQHVVALAKIAPILVEFVNEVARRAVAAKDPLMAREGHNSAGEVPPSG
jgi:hypothetical protein